MGKSKKPRRNIQINTPPELSFSLCDRHNIVLSSPYMPCAICVAALSALEGGYDPQIHPATKFRDPGGDKCTTTYPQVIPDQFHPWTSTEKASFHFNHSGRIWENQQLVPLLPCYRCTTLGPSSAVKPKWANSMCNQFVTTAFSHNMFLRGNTWKQTRRKQDERQKKVALWAQNLGTGLGLSFALAKQGMQTSAH